MDISAMPTYRNFNFRNFFRFIWLILIVSVLIHYGLYSSTYTADTLQSYFNSNSTNIFYAYVCLSLVRSFFFLPSTIFVIMGVVLYPNQPFLVLFISMSGILVGATWVYFSARILKIEQLFSKKNQARLKNVRYKIQKHGFLIVIGWSFFPPVPTDLICYVAGYAQMKFLKFIAALLIGELFLVSIYVWTGKGIFQLVFN